MNKTRIYYVYVLRSSVDQNFYVDLTDDLEQRLIRHNEGRVKSTKFRKPFNLVHYETFNDSHQARQREKCLKSAMVELH